MGRATLRRTSVNKRAAADQPMKLAYLTSQYPATSHTFISREVAAMRRLGVQLDTFSIRGPTKAELEDSALADEARKTFTVLEQPSTRIVGAHLRMVARQPRQYFSTFARAMRHRAPGLKGLILGVAHFAEAVVLAEELMRRRATALHNHFANSGATVGYLTARLLKIPWSFTIHGISETDYPAGLMLGRKIAAAEFVACVSYFGRAQAMRLVEPNQWPKLHVVRCGLPLASLPTHTKPGETVRIICVGRLSPEKGQAGLLEAFATITKDQDQVELLLVGDGPERGPLQSRAESLRLTDRVSFAGRCSEQETLDHIARAHILVLPSFMEGLPIVLIEAMAIGTPVIASRVAGIPELVEDGQSGLLFTPSDWGALASCMRRLINDEALRARLARAGRTTVEAEFDIARSARVMRVLFETRGAQVLA
jgi:colanic acid/amylovoran biosynthesis glycosyltransferase